MKKNRVSETLIEISYSFIEKAKGFDLGGDLAIKTTLTELEAYGLLYCLWSQTSRNACLILMFEDATCNV